MHFANASMLKLLFLVPLFWFFLKVLRKNHQKKIAQNFGSKLYPFLSSSLSLRKRQWKDILQSVVLVLAIVALARPQSGGSKQEVTSQGVELMMLIDVSESMMAEDVRPNRLEQAKGEMSRLLDLLPGSKVGLIAFAGSATLLSPLSSDPGALKMFIDSLSPLAVSTQGTEFKKAILEAKEAFNRGGVDQDDTSKATRVILIASDGEDHEPGALEEAEKLAAEGTRIFTLAYGTEKGGPIPEKDQMGYLRGYKKDRRGQTVLTTVVGKELEALAQAGKGSFYHAFYGGDQIQKVAEDIDKLEKAQFQSEVQMQYDEDFQKLLFLAVVFALIELFLGERRTGFKIWKGRFEVPPA